MDGDVAEPLCARLYPRDYGCDVRQSRMTGLRVAHDLVEDRWLLLMLRHHLTGDHTTLEVMQEDIRANLSGQAERLAAPRPFRNLIAQARLGMRPSEHEVYFRALLNDVAEPTAPFGLLDVRRDGTEV